MPKLVDPDSLNRGTEIVFDTTNKTIQLLVAGNLDDTSPGRTSGVTEQAVYSKCKELWKDEVDLNKLKFPFTAITEVKMDLINGWDWADSQTKQLIRDGGWSLRSGSANVLSQSYMNITSLGTFVTSSDQAYYLQQTGSISQSFDKTGEVNEYVWIYSLGSFDYRDYFKVFLREQGKTFVESNLISEQDLTTLDYTVYKVPLANAVDVKITNDDDYITGSYIYTTASISYLSGSWFGTYVGGNTYTDWQVVYSASSTVSESHWYRVIEGQGPVTSNPVATPADWELYPGERQIGDAWYAFDTIIRSIPEATASLEEIYEWIQYELRQAYDINDDIDGDGIGYVTGSTADLLASFLGDTLQTKPGVYIDNFDSNDTNRIQLFDLTVDTSGSTSTARTFPFVAAGTITFNTVLINDDSASYKMYFTNNDAGDDDGSDYDTVNAIIVNDNDGNPITGSIPPGGTVNFTYDYDFNIQRGSASSGSDAPITIAAIGLSGAQWISAEFTITRATGLSFPVNAAQERNYSNPA